MTITDKDFRMESMEYYGFGIKAMESSKVCTQCGAMSPATDQFCKECGKRLPTENLYQVYKKRHKCCSDCETVIADTALYCPQCGRKL